MQRHYSALDKILMGLDAGLNTAFGSYPEQRSNPAARIDETSLSQQEKRKSAGLMRVNHSGEVCAQALYRGQLNFAQAKATRHMLEKASLEETDHLAWCDKRLKELDSHRSYLNLFWYWKSYCLGAFAAFLGDRWSLGFLAETETQVEQHLQSHLHKLPENDLKSRAIVQQMKIDEAQHSHAAQRAGAAELPSLIKKMMRTSAKVMTSLSYFI